MKTKKLPLTSLLMILSLTLSITQCGTNRGNSGNQDTSQTTEICSELPLESWERFQQPAFKGFMHAYQPCVIEVPDKEYPYRMWFFGWVSEIANPGQVPG